MVRVRPSVAVSDEEVLPALLRQSFALFFRFAFREVSGGELQWNFHIDAMIHQLERLRRGENRKRVIPIPPRHLKSVTMTAWVAWMLGNDPSLKFICASYGYDLAEKHARDCLKIMSAPWYREAFARLTIEKKAILNLTTSQSGYRLSTSVGGVVTGLGADYVIIDDPMKADDAHSEAERKRVIDWFDNALPFRLESLERSAFVVIMQRLHEDDLAGNLLSRGGWHELRLPAIATADELIEVGPGRFYQRREGHALHPARQSLAILTQLKAENAMSFAAQQQQDPVPATGNYVDPAWFQYYDDPPERGLVVQSWDTASKTGLSNDYSVGITARYFNRRYYVLDVCRQRMDFATPRRRVDHLCAHYGVERLLIEDASSGQQLIQIMRAAPGRSPRPIACKPDDDKAVRFHAQASKIEGGEVVLPKSAPWLADFIKEICAFPNGRYKDQADALGQLLKFGAPRWTDEDTSVAAPIFFSRYSSDERWPDF